MRPPTDFLTLTRDAGERLWRHTRHDSQSQPCLLPDAIALTDQRTALPDNGRYEPALVATPFLMEFVEAERLDPERAEMPPDAPAVSPLARLIRGPLGSLGLHILVVLLILVPAATLPRLPEPIPIALVLVTPPPPASPPPAPAKPPPPKPPPETIRPPGRLSSVDMGEAMAKSTAAGDGKPAAAKPAPPKLVPPPKPAPAQLAGLTVPRLAAPTPETRRRAEPPHAPPHPGAVPGPAATRDEYLAYLVTLTRQHFNVLPLSLIGDRHGETSLAVRVMADGTIAQISIAQGSGYPEIDRRVEQMVAAVGRFPPLPQWFQGDSMELVFKLRFPEGLERR